MLILAFKFVFNDKQLEEICHLTMFMSRDNDINDPICDEFKNWMSCRRGKFNKTEACVTRSDFFFSCTRFATT